jgi:hypothetical protein
VYIHIIFIQGMKLMPASGDHLDWKYQGGDTTRLTGRGFRKDVRSRKNHENEGGSAKKGISGRLAQTRITKHCCYSGPEQPRLMWSYSSPYREADS